MLLVCGSDGLRSPSQAAKFGISMNKLEYVADSVSAGTTLEMPPQAQAHQQQPGYAQQPQHQQQPHQQAQHGGAGAGQGGAADKKTGQRSAKKKTKV